MFSIRASCSVAVSARTALGPAVLGGCATIIKGIGRRYYWLSWSRRRHTETTTATEAAAAAVICDLAWHFACWLAGPSLHKWNKSWRWSWSWSWNWKAFIFHTVMQVSCLAKKFLRNCVLVWAFGLAINCAAAASVLWPQKGQRVQFFAVRSGCWPQFALYATSNAFTWSHSLCLLRSASSELISTLASKLITPNNKLHSKDQLWLSQPPQLFRKQNSLRISEEDFYFRHTQSIVLCDWFTF